MRKLLLPLLLVMLPLAASDLTKLQIVVTNQDGKPIDRASVIVPNQDLITGVVKNMTHGNPIGRLSIKLGVGYDSDMDRVREILLDIAQAHPQVMRTPAPNVVFMGFGVLALDVELRCFVANVEHALATRSDLNFAILRRFREAGIGIPTNPAEVKLAEKPSVQPE